MENPCLECAACCRGNSIVYLSPREARRRMAAGQKLIKLLPHSETFVTPTGNQRSLIDHSWLASGYRIARNTLRSDDPNWALADHAASVAPVMQLGDGMYATDSDCPFLIDKACSIYDDRDRMCKEFPVASSACNRFRVERGLGTVSVSIREK